MVISEYFVDDINTAEVCHFWDLIGLSSEYNRVSAFDIELTNICYLITTGASFQENLCNCDFLAPFLKKWTLES